MVRAWGLGLLSAVALMAQAPDLAADPQWRALLHVPPKAERSTMGDPRFFLDPSMNPARELTALRRALEGPDRQAVIDRFPLRATWLLARMDQTWCLGFAEIPRGGARGGTSRTEGEQEATHAWLPPRSYQSGSSPAFEAFFQNLQPRRALVVFADASLGSSASMFGHTFLVVQGVQGAELLQPAVNFAADSGDTSGISRAVKGLTGGFMGSFTWSPYVEKVKEYTVLAHRDLWEYPLDLEEAQVRKLLMHLWELRELKTPYYFTSRNCSYHLLQAIQAVCPERDLLSDLPPWVPPLETVRILGRKGLLKEGRWRPSHDARLQALAQQLTRAEVTKALDMAHGTDAPQGSATLLDVASLELQSRILRGEITQENYAARQLLLLKARSELGILPPAPPPPPPPQPHLAHGGQYAQLGLARDAAGIYLECRWRPTFHALLDPPLGSASGLELTLLDLGLRWRKGQSPEVADSTLFSLASFRPRRPWHKPLSWRIQAGYEATGGGQGTFGAGVGLTYGKPSVACYGLVQGEARSLRGAPGGAVGVGLETGCLLQSSPRVRWKAHLRHTSWLAGRPGTSTEVGLAGRWDGGISLKALHRRAWGQGETRVSLGWGTHF